MVCKIECLIFWGIRKSTSKEVRETRFVNIIRKLQMLIFKSFISFPKLKNVNYIIIANNCPAHTLQNAVKKAADQMTID